jgi:uncharacterized protein
MSFMYQKLSQSDFDIFDDFLKTRAETSMFLRSNAKKVGLDYEQNQPYKAHYYGAFQEGHLQGVIAFCWNGNILIQCPPLSLLENLLNFIKDDLPHFKIKGVIAPSLQCNKLKEHLKVKDENINFQCVDVVLALNLKDIKIPMPLQSGEYSLRYPQENELNKLAKWRVAYEKESFDAVTSYESAFQEISSEHQNDELFVLEHECQIVSMAAYNAKLPDIVQIGGVYTPPSLRRRQYARSAVAGALLKAYGNGIQNSVLFSNNVFAIKSYESLGYKKCEDDYHICLFKKPYPF